MPQIRFALSRGFTVSVNIIVPFTRGGARRLACPVHICHPAGVLGLRLRQQQGMHRVYRFEDEDEMDSQVP
jgi:hypothetical protein